MKDSLISELPDFDDPLGILHACHERMLAQCDTLQGLVAHITQNGVDEEARSAIRNAINYFTTSAVHHHHDEEQDLFPVLNRQSLKLADIIYRLKQEHVLLTQLWESLLKDLKQPSALTENAEFGSHVERFCSAYREHIDYENKELLGMAQHILSRQQLKDLGSAMAKRRGVRR